MTDFYLYLNELRAANLELLVRVRNIEDASRLQGSIMTIEDIKNFTMQDEQETEMQNKYLGDNEQWTQ